MKNIAILIWGLRNGGAERIAGLLSKYLSQRYRVYLFLHDTTEIVYEYDGEIVDVGKYGSLYLEYYIDYYKRKYEIDCTISFLETSNIINIRTKKDDCVIVSERLTMSLFAKPQYHNVYQKKKFFGKADGIVSVSEGVKYDLIHAFGVPAEKIRTIYNFIDQETIKEKANEKIEPDIEDFIQGSRLFVNIGRLEKQKNQLRLIQQFAALKAEHEDIKLLIIGSGSMETELLKKIKLLGLEADVRLLHYCANPFPYLRRADVYVMASHHEGLPNAVLEAMCLQIPVVAVDCLSGPRELLAGWTDYGNKVEGYQLCERGILVADENTDDDGTTNYLKDAMAYLLNCEEYANRVKENQEAYMDGYCNQEILAQWIDVIESSMKNQSRIPFENELDLTKKIVIYGAGEYGQKIFWQLQNEGVKIFSFAVTEKNENTEEVSGVPVREICELVPYKETCTVIVGTIAFRSEIVKLLMDLGFEDIYFRRFIPDKD